MVASVQREGDWGEDGFDKKKDLGGDGRPQKEERGENGALNWPKSAN